MTEEKNNQNQEKPDTWLNEDALPEDTQNDEKPSSSMPSSTKVIIGIFLVLVAGAAFYSLVLGKGNGKKSDDPKGNSVPYQQLLDGIRSSSKNFYNLCANNPIATSIAIAAVSGLGSGAIVAKCCSKNVLPGVTTFTRISRLFKGGVWINVWKAKKGEKISTFLRFMNKESLDKSIPEIVSSLS